MKLNLLAPLLLIGLLATPAFGHGNHDDDSDDVPAQATPPVVKESAATAPKAVATPNLKPAPAATTDKPIPAAPKQP